MAAPRITSETVYRAADELVERGQHPSAATVREYLGSGSYTTINKHLQQWREDQERALSAVELPESVESTYRKAAITAYRAGQQVSAGDLATMREALELERRKRAEELAERDQEIARLEILVEPLQTAQQRLQMELDSLRQQQGQLHEKAATAVANCDVITQQNDALTTRVKELETENRALNRQICKLVAR